MRGTQKRDKKNHVIVREQKFNPGQIKYVRTLAVFLSFFFCRPLNTTKKNYKKIVSKVQKSKTVFSRFGAYLDEGRSKAKAVFKKNRALVLFWPRTRPPTKGVTGFSFWRPLDRHVVR
jgi:hypothetical protein